MDISDIIWLMAIMTLVVSAASYVLYSKTERRELGIVTICFAVLAIMQLLFLLTISV